MDYTSLTDQSDQPAGLSSVALSLNGQTLDRVIEGYRTLKVSGRETLSQEIQPEEVPTGTLVLNNRLPAREITVTYNLKANDGTTLQQRFKKLRKHLTGDLIISFRDEPKTYYLGLLSEMEAPPDHTNDKVGTFVLYCPDPYKFGPVQTTGGEVTIDTFYPTPPEQIKVSVTNTTNKLEVTDGNYTITATGTFNGGNDAIFRFDREAMTLTVAGEEATYMVDLNSDFENFRLTQGDTVRCPQGSVELKARERWL